MPAFILAAVRWFADLKTSTQVILILITFIVVGATAGYLYMDYQIRKAKQVEEIERQARSDTHQEIITAVEEKVGQVEEKLEDSTNAREAEELIDHANLTQDELNRQLRLAARRAIEARKQRDKERERKKRLAAQRKKETIDENNKPKK